MVGGAVAEAEVVLQGEAHTLQGLGLALHLLFQLAGDEDGRIVDNALVDDGIKGALLQGGAGVAGAARAFVDADALLKLLQGLDAGQAKVLGELVVQLGNFLFLDALNADLEVGRLAA